MHFLVLLLLLKIAPSFVCSSCHYLNNLKKLCLCLCSLQLPYLRWKRSAVVAALCILAVRAVIVQLAFFLHIQASLHVASFLMQRNVHGKQKLMHSHVKFLWNSNGLWCLPDLCFQKTSSFYEAIDVCNWIYDVLLSCNSTFQGNSELYGMQLLKKVSSRSFCLQFDLL